MNERTLREKLKQDFKLETWKEILEACFPQRIFYSTPKPAPLNRKVQQELAEFIHHIGEVPIGNEKMALIDVQLKDHATHLTRNRVGLRKLVDSEVIAGVKDAAIIVYHQPGYKEWRISFYSEHYGWDEKEGLVKEETNPKRYTFVVGGEETCRTAAQRLKLLLSDNNETTLEKVLEAFSVEKVSKHFFDEYKYQYDKFVSYLTGKVWTKEGEQKVGERISQFSFFFKSTTNHEKEARDFVKKLLGRIVFLYFVQKKGWLGASSDEFKDGNVNFIQTLFEEVKRDNKEDSFYSEWLRKLFFKGLNNKNQQKFDMPDGSECYIPFLNGGLFEQDETDKNTEFMELPGWLFYNPEHMDEPEDKYDRPIKRGFLDFLNAFNFTIHEDSPGDHTIAVDPEMLGHIFEYLLEDNKEKGAYYTPKPIVHYMCQESLIEYLNNSLSGDENLRSNIEALIKNQETKNLDPFYEKILTAIKNVKVCDPAIGSGAFPMGILQEIYQIVETIYYASPDDVKAIWSLTNNGWHPAQIKRQIIQNSIYGVDIEQGAIDIARLRFWLSLIVDEEVPTSLPNLDYKIVVGDSLVSRLVLDGEEQIININWEMKGEVASTKEHLKNLNEALNAIISKKQQYFEASSDIKEKLKDDIEQLKIVALIHQLHFDREYYIRNTEEKGGLLPTAKEIEHNQNRKLAIIGFDNLIKNLEKAKKDSKILVQFFDWKLEFPEIMNPNFKRGSIGFDIVIANPPYGITVIDDYRRITEETLGKVPDYEIYYLFIQLLNNLVNTNTICTYIIPNSLIFNVFAAKYRKDLLNDWKIIELLDCTNFEIFDATVRNIILTLRRYSDDINIGYRKTNGINSFSKLIVNKREIISKEDLLKFNQNWGLAFKLDKNIIQIVNKIKKNSTPLNSYFEVSQGYIPYRRRDLIEKFGEERGNAIVDKREWHSIKKINSKYKQEIQGRGLSKYFYNKADSFVYYGKHLATYIEPKFFNQRRLLIREITNPTIIGCIVEEELVNDPQIISVIPNSKNEISISTLWGYINSKIATFFHFNASPKATKGAFPKILVTDVKKFPVPIKLVKVDSKTKSLVDNILSIKQNNPAANIDNIEKKIDIIMYKLYDLNWKEINVVDPDFDISEIEYNSFKF